MKFFQKLFGIKDQSELIEEKFKKIQDETFSELSSLRSQVQRAQNELAVKERIINEQNSKLRKQNEADLFLEIKRLEKKILEGEKDPNIENLRSLQNQQSYLMAQQGALRSGLGIGAAFGRGLI